LFIKASNTKIVVFFLLGDTPVSEFYIPTFRNTVCSILISDVSRKNSRYEIVVVYIYIYKGKGLARKLPAQIGRRGKERGRFQVEEQGVEGKHPKWRPVVNT